MPSLKKTPKILSAPPWEASSLNKVAGTFRLGRHVHTEFTLPALQQSNSCTASLTLEKVRTTVTTALTENRKTVLCKSSSDSNTAESGKHTSTSVDTSAAFWASVLPWASDYTCAISRARR